MATAKAVQNGVTMMQVTPQPAAIDGLQQQVAQLRDAAGTVSRTIVTTTVAREAVQLPLSPPLRVTSVAYKQTGDRDGYWFDATLKVSDGKQVALGMCTLVILAFHAKTWERVQLKLTAVEMLDEICSSVLKSDATHAYGLKTASGWFVAMQTFDGVRELDWTWHTKFKNTNGSQNDCSMGRIANGQPGKMCEAGLLFGADHLSLVYKSASGFARSANAEWKLLNDAKLDRVVSLSAEGYLRICDADAKLEEFTAFAARQPNHAERVKEQQRRQAELRARMVQQLQKQQQQQQQQEQQQQQQQQQQPQQQQQQQQAERGEVGDGPAFPRARLTKRQTIRFLHRTQRLAEATIDEADNGRGEPPTQNLTADQRLMPPPAALRPRSRAKRGEMTRSQSMRSALASQVRTVVTPVERAERSAIASQFTLDDTSSVDLMLPWSTDEYDIYMALIKTERETLANGAIRLQSGVILHARAGQLRRVSLPHRWISAEHSALLEDERFKSLTEKAIVATIHEMVARNSELLPEWYETLNCSAGDSELASAQQECVRKQEQNDTSPHISHAISSNGAGQTPVQNLTRNLMTMRDYKRGEKIGDSAPARCLSLAAIVGMQLGHMMFGYDKRQSLPQNIASSFICPHTDADFLQFGDDGSGTPTPIVFVGQQVRPNAELVVEMAPAGSLLPYVVYLRALADLSSSVYLLINRGKKMLATYECATGEPLPCVVSLARERIMAAHATQYGAEREQQQEFGGDENDFVPITDADADAAAAAVAADASAVAAVADDDDDVADVFEPENLFDNASQAPTLASVMAEEADPLATPSDADAHSVLFNHHSSQRGTLLFSQSSQEPTRMLSLGTGDEQSEFGGDDASCRIAASPVNENERMRSISLITEILHNGSSTTNNVSSSNNGKSAKKTSVRRQQNAKSRLASIKERVQQQARGIDASASKRVRGGETDWALQQSCNLSESKRRRVVPAGTSVLRDDHLRDYVFGRTTGAENGSDEAANALLTFSNNKSLGLEKNAGVAAIERDQRFGGLRYMPQV